MQIHTFKKAIVSFVSALFFACTFALLAGCSLNPVADSEAGNPSVISTAALIEIPSSLIKTGTNDFNRQQRIIEDDPAESLYDIVRFHNYFVNELVNGDSNSVRVFINQFIAKLPWKQIEEIGSYIADSAYFHFEATYKAAEQLPCTVLIENKLPFVGWKIMTAFNGNPKFPVGWLYYFTDYTGDLRTDSLSMLVYFGKNATMKTVTVLIDQKIVIPTENIAQSFVYSIYESNDIVHLSGSAYHPYLDSILDDTIGYCFTYGSVADRKDNRAVVNLGLPPSVYNDTALIYSDTGYGIEAVIGRCFIDYEIDPLSDTLKMILATSYCDTLTIEQILIKMAIDTSFKLHDPSETDSMTIEDLKFFLELNKNISNVQIKKEYAKLLWILKLNQPVYYDITGYAGNGETVPAGFETIAAIDCNRPRFIPSAVAALTITVP